MSSRPAVGQILRVQAIFLSADFDSACESGGETTVVLMQAGDFRDDDKPFRFLRSIVGRS